MTPPASVALGGRDEASEDSLPHLVAEVRRLQSAVGVHLWQMGQCLQKLHAHEAWWKPKWSRWDAFTRGELGITGPYAYKLIDVATSFTEREVIDCGATKLIRILPVLKPDRARFVEQAKTASVAEIRASVNRYRLGQAAQHPAGIVPVRQTGRDSRKSAHKMMRAEHVRADERIVALYVGSATCSTRAKRIEDLPSGRVLLGSRAYLVVVRATGHGLVLGMRPEPSEDELSS